MSTVQAKTSNTPKPQGYRFWMGCFALMLLSPFLIYYGYCWGLWGRNSLLLQYLFQCNCPTFSEESRYPKDVDVIVSACTHNYSELSPSGRFLLVNEGKPGLLIYLYDLQTMEKVPAQSISSFLTDDLWFIEGGIEDFIMDRTTGKQYPNKIFRFWRDNAYINGEPNLELLVNALHQAEQVFFIQSNDTVVVLMSDFPTNLEQNFNFDRSDIPGGDSNRVEQFLKENDISYLTILPRFPHEVVSPDGRFVARDDGIYLVETNEMIVKAPISFVAGWTYDGHGAIYGASRRCLLTLGLPFGDDTWCEIVVPQPVLKLKVPEEYPVPAETP